MVQRTLRRQVREYVRYTNRRSIVEDFAPSPEEQDLYEKVSEYLRRSEAAAIEPGKKTLLTLVLPQAARLLHLRHRPHAAEARGQPGEAAATRRSCGQRRRWRCFEPEEAKQFAEEGEEWSRRARASPPPSRTLQNELWELQQYADLADSIKVNAKGEALKRALDRTFTVARAHQWPEKAVIFTESRRTQEYLFNLLSRPRLRGEDLAALR